MWQEARSQGQLKPSDSGNDEEKRGIKELDRRVGAKACVIQIWWISVYRPPRVTSQRLWWLTAVQILLASTGAVSQASAPKAVRPSNLLHLTTLMLPVHVFKQQGQKLTGLGAKMPLKVAKLLQILRVWMQKLPFVVN